MTTVAFKDGQLAADTLHTTQGSRAGYQRKILRQGRCLIGYAGAASNFEAFRNWLATGALGKFTSQDGNVFIIPPTGFSICWEDGDTPWRETQPYWALGSGGEYAMGAMTAGATAEEAVRIACQHDTGSGGDVTVLYRHGSARAPDPWLTPNHLTVGCIVPWPQSPPPTSVGHIVRRLRASRG